MSEGIRINKYIAECTGCSRREAEKFVEKGHVKINNQIVTDLSARVGLKDKVLLNNKAIKIPAYRYVIFNKPAGVITTRSDEKDRKTIYDLLPDNLHDLKPVGRLDRDSSGLILLTNDGDVINNLTHPKYEIPKRYKVSLKGNFTLANARKFAEGMDIGETQPAVASVISIIRDTKGLTRLELELHQGMNRQIRRMAEKLGYEVASLKRISMGPLNLKNLKRGEFSILKSKEVDKLFEYLAKRSKEN